MAGGDGGPCGCEVLGYGFDVGDAPGDDGVGEQGDSFALDVLAVDVSAAASLISAIPCSTDVATSAWVRVVGTIRSTTPDSNHNPTPNHHLPHSVAQRNRCPLSIFYGNPEVDDSTHGFEYANRWRHFWVNGAGWVRYCRYSAGFTRLGGSRNAWSQCFGGVGCCRYPPDTCKSGFEGRAH